LRVPKFTDGHETRRGRARPVTQPMHASPFAGLGDSEPDGWFEPKRKAYLLPQSGGGAPLPLESTQWVVGRDSDVDFQLADPTASRRHARILAVHNRYYVQDLGSTNGTFVNRNRVTHERLAHSDLVAFAKTVFRFVMVAELDGDYLKKLNLDTLMSLVDVVDKKDTYTNSHSEVVSRVARRLALELGFSPAAAERVGIGGRLHDIGKIGVPDAVLRKTAQLDDAEIALIRKHPRDGEAILAPLEFVSDLLPMVRQHHERFDGLGYPDGLAGQTIAVEARIVHVADAYHAMASQRPYRKPLFQEFIRQEFVKTAGTQFDPEVTRAFLNLLPSLPRLLATIT
jgi:HD-GYP domain-containing protein (c-di-GMP phosphodiesterase class II)